MYVYGAGNHLIDMLNWHPELENKIERIFDKDENKIGKVMIGPDKVIETPDVLKTLPKGSEIAISAIRYFDEISQEIHDINPDISCVNIDEWYNKIPGLDEIKVSIIIPVYNTEKYIGECLDSVINQSLQEIEVICVNDGSTDGSLKIMKEYAEKDNRIKIINQENAGQGAARNVGIDASLGKYIYCLDSDDMVTRISFAEMYDTAEKNRLDGLFFNHRFQFEMSEVSKRLPINRYWADASLEEKGVMNGEDFFVETRMDRYGHVNQNRYLWRRKFLDDHGIRNVEETSPHEDSVFGLLGVVQAERIMGVAKSYHIRRYRDGSVVTSDDAGMLIKRCKACFLVRLAELNFIENYKFKNEGCKKLACGVPGANLGMMYEVYDRIPDKQKCHLVFNKAEYNEMFQELLRKRGKNPHKEKNVFSKETSGMYVYGVGEHLFDMLSWHPELGKRIHRLFDRDAKKIGTKVESIGRLVEAPEAMKTLPSGTEIAVSALRYYDEIVTDIHEINPNLVCRTIDEVYEMLLQERKAQDVKPVSLPAGKRGFRTSGLTDLQRQRLKGKDAQQRWRRKFLMECFSSKHVFWGVCGARATYLRRHFIGMMQRNDIFIEENRSMCGKSVEGLPVCAPGVLKDLKGKFHIIIMNENYEGVREHLLDYGYVENVDFAEGRALLEEDENGLIDVPCVDKVTAGMIVYGEGAHLADMLSWHPELASRISRVIDKDEKKKGRPCHGVGVPIESITAVRDLPRGTELAVAAIKYLPSIAKDVHALNSGVICRNIDEIWMEYVKTGVCSTDKSGGTPKQTQLLHERYEAPYLREIRKVDTLSSEEEQKIKGNLENPARLDMVRLVVVLGTKCSLRCRDCNNLIPLFRPQFDVDKDELLVSMKRIFTLVDSMVRLELIGGEPFLSKNLSDALGLALNQPQIKQVEITTNATVMPDLELIPLLQNGKVLVRISDYGDLVDKEKLIWFCLQHFIRYEVLAIGNWFSSGGTERRHLAEDELIRGYKNCDAGYICTTLYNGRLYECARSASLHALGKMEEEEYLPINGNTSKEDVKEFLLRPYSLACDYCSQALPKKIKVPPAVQIG